MKIQFKVPKPFPYQAFVGYNSPILQKAQFDGCQGAKAQECTKQNIPVLVDMAYLSLTTNRTYNVSYPCIKTVTTSLSKVFPVEHFRIGIRFNRDLTDDTLDAYTNQQNPYVNLFGVDIGHKLINHYPESWLYERWQSCSR